MYSRSPFLPEELVVVVELLGVADTSKVNNLMILLPKNPIVLSKILR